VVVTRRFRPEDPGGAAIAALAPRYPGRVSLGNDLPLPDYYRTLWRSQLQVSTASHESLGMATLEAMYTATCCVLPRVADYPALCGNHPDVLYEPGPEGLRDRLVHLHRHEVIRINVGQELSRRAAQIRRAGRRRRHRQRARRDRGAGRRDWRKPRGELSGDHTHDPALTDQSPFEGTGLPAPGPA
jgi:hypothetical protein